MQIMRDGIDRVPDGVRTVVSIGSYDGLHRGHQKVLTTMVERARAADLQPAVVTFNQHPASVVRPGDAPLLLTNHEQRLELFAELGVDWLYLLDFDEERSQTSERDFVSDVLVDRLAAAQVVVGSNFGFGKGRSGSVDTLAELGVELGFDVVGLDLFGDAGSEAPISSTSIRTALAAGEIDRVNAMLGRPFEVRGEVVRGDERARKIGFPTANIRFQPGYAWPAIGVYSAWATVPDGSRHRAAVNIGLRPTFHDDADAPLLEVHLLDFEGDLYGRSVAVEFVTRLRDERRFDGIEEISAQLQRDIAAARDALLG